MNRRIFNSIFLTALIVFVGALALLVGVLYKYYTDEHLEQLWNQTSTIAKGIEDEGRKYLKGLDLGDYRVTWIGEDGEIIFDSSRDPEKMPNHKEREEVKEAFDEGKGESIRKSDTMMEKYVYCAIRIKDGTVVRVSDSRFTAFTLIRNSIVPLLLIVLAAVLISLFMSRRLSRWITKPMEEGIKSAVDEKGYKELQPLLDENERKRREFTANVSHELKTPLQTITGYAELMKNGMVAEEDVVPFAEKIYVKSVGMTNLVNDIIDLSHLDEGASDLEEGSVDLLTTASDVADHLREQAESMGIAMEVTGSHVMVYGHPQLIRTTINNLCDNSIRYNVPGGMISVNVMENDGRGIISVKDTGIGIPKDEQERIFERFYRVDKSHSREVGGTGLGLSIVKHAVNADGGSIKVESAPGEGTVISVCYPLEK